MPTTSPNSGAPQPTMLSMDPARDAVRLLLSSGRAGWAFVGVCLALAIVATMLAIISGVLLPLVFAVVLAICFRPLATRLQRARRVSPAAASGVVVLGLLAAAGGVVWATVTGIVSQSGNVMAELQKALVEAGASDSAATGVTDALKELQPTIAQGFLDTVIAGISSLSGLIGGVLLGVLIMYYLLKDGNAFRTSMVGKLRSDRGAQFDAFVTDACVVLRQYWLGRTIVSAIVAGVVGLAAWLMGLPLVGTLMAVTFIGGYIPYIGAVLGGALAVMVAVGTNGLPSGVLMLVIVLVANLVIENLVDPLVTGRTLQIHPLLVLIVTTLGGILGGLVGLMMAVPVTVIAGRAVTHLRAAVEVDTDSLRESIRLTMRSEPPDSGDH